MKAVSKKQNGRSNRLPANECEREAGEGTRRRWTRPVDEGWSGVLMGGAVRAMEKDAASHQLDPVSSD